MAVSFPECGWTLTRTPGGLPKFPVRGHNALMRTVLVSEASVADGVARHVIT